MALKARELVDDETLLRWLLDVFHGRDPSAPQAKEGEPASVLGTVPPDWSIRMKALEMFLNRRNGMPMQEIHVKAELEALVTAVQGPILDVIPVEELGLDELGKLESRVERALEARVGAVPIDAEAVEVEP